MKLSDLLAIVFFITISVFLIFFTDTFITLTKTYPYFMGFVKFSLLATFGEGLKSRILYHAWTLDKVAIRIIVWGVFGCWITAAFPFIDAGVVAISPPYSHLWINISNNLVAALSKSLWINIFSGYAFFMMLSHYWIDIMIKNRCFCWPWKIFDIEGTKRWAMIIFKSMIFFWLPAHTLTFSLPPEWRIICAAYLSVALGLILSFAASQSTRRA